MQTMQRSFGIHLNPPHIKVCEGSQCMCCSFANSFMICSIDSTQTRVHRTLHEYSFLADAARIRGLSVYFAINCLLVFQVQVSKYPWPCHQVDISSLLAGSPMEGTMGHLHHLLQITEKSLFWLAQGRCIHGPQHARAGPGEFPHLGWPLLNLSIWIA